MPLSDLAKHDFLKSSRNSEMAKPDYRELTVAEIFGGKDLYEVNKHKRYPGLFAAMRKFMQVRGYEEHQVH